MDKHHLMLLTAGALVAIGFAALAWVGRLRRGRHPTLPPGFAAAILVLLAVVGGSVILVLHRAAPAPGPSGKLERCLTLEQWWWVDQPGGAATVVARVKPGLPELLALDARAQSGSDEDLLEPGVLTARLQQAPAQAGQPVVLARRLRRVAPGKPSHVLLRFSCRPLGAQGASGVVSYVAQPTSALEGTPDLVRTLPAPSPGAAPRADVIN